MIRAKYPGPTPSFFKEQLKNNLTLDQKYAIEKFVKSLLKVRSSYMVLKKYYMKIDLNHFETDIKPATMPTSLDFGYRYLTNYPKHKYRVNDINLNDGTLVSYSNKQIHVWTSPDMLNKAKGFNPYEKDQLDEVEFQKQELPAKALFVCRFFEVSKSH